MFITFFCLIHDLAFNFSFELILLLHIFDNQSVSNEMICGISCSSVKEKKYSNIGFRKYYLLINMWSGIWKLVLKYYNLLRNLDKYSKLYHSYAKHKILHLFLWYLQMTNPWNTNSKTNKRNKNKLKKYHATT